jgi:transcriptional regulator with XRE-family HTH domain
MPEPKDLGALLKNLRNDKSMKLRDVEQETQKNEFKVSNAYISQLESGTIKNPSPNVLYALSEVYEVPYSTLMETAGYVVPGGEAQKDERLTKLQIYASSLTDEEFDMAIEYIKMLKNLRKKTTKR